MTKPSQVKSVSSKIIREKDNPSQIDLDIFLLWTEIHITVEKELAMI